MGQISFMNNNDDPENQDLEELRKKAHLEVYKTYSILIDETEKALFVEGKQSQEAQKRYQKIIAAFLKGYLSEMVEKASSPDSGAEYSTKLTPEQISAIESVILSVTPQGGRALAEIFVLQLAVKSVCPEQDVRLHKGSNASNRFSWREGISLRHLDDTFIVPALRDSGLLRMNQFGAFMTRTFAENYPFTVFYKAEMAGAKENWLRLIDQVEEGKLESEAALLYALNLLWRSSEKFNNMVNATLQATTQWVADNQPISEEAVLGVMVSHIESSEARARLLEVTIHSLMQALSELHVDLGGNLKSLMPMRTANLKHGNLGDIEVLNGDIVMEAWDAKYKTPYLSDAIEELRSKIKDRNVAELTFGYIVFPAKESFVEVDKKIEGMRAEYGLEMQILSYSEWVKAQFKRAEEAGVDKAELAERWLVAYIESLGQRRREIAPIDEPTFEWVETFQAVITKS